jgi:hypothetical protein
VVTDSAEQASAGCSDAVRSMLQQTIGSPAVTKDQVGLTV